jgi:DNA-directed RNA polymerase II subunit RPB2
MVDTDKLIVWEVKFGQASVNSTPRITEEDEKYGAVYPHEARMRNLTYATELFVDIALCKKELERHNYDTDPKTG